MYDARVFTTKYVNAEAKNSFAHSKMMIHRAVASESTCSVAQTSASYISRCVDIQGYHLQKQRTSIHGDPSLWYSHLSPPAIILGRL